MGDAIDDFKFDDDPFKGALADLESQMQNEFKAAPADLQKSANEIIATLTEIKALSDKAGSDRADIEAKTKAVKDDLAAFENRFGSAGQKIGAAIKSKVNGFLPFPI